MQELGFRVRGISFGVGLRLPGLDFRVADPQVRPQRLGSP